MTVRKIVYIGMGAFYESVEQRDDPILRSVGYAVSNVATNRMARRAFRMASPQGFCGWKWPGTGPARSAPVEQPRVCLRTPPRQRCRVARISRL
jgi:hypothetical protein